MRITGSTSIFSEMELISTMAEQVPVLAIVPEVVQAGNHSTVLSIGPHRFVREIDAALGEQVLDVAVAQREAEIQPDGVLDDLGREAMAAVADVAYPLS